MSATIYQKRISEKLGLIFGEEQVKNEWSVTKGATDGWQYGNGCYAPRVDVGVGPFNVNSGKLIGQIGEETHPLIIKIKEKVRGGFVENHNPRCLLAIEVEFSGSSKHVIGDFANASLLGHVGVVVSSNKNFPKIERVLNYIHYVTNVGKADGLFANVALYSEGEFEQLIDKHLNVSRDS